MRGGTFREPMFRGSPGGIALCCHSSLAQSAVIFLTVAVVDKWCRQPRVKFTGVKIFFARHVTSMKLLQRPNT